MMMMMRRRAEIGAGKIPSMRMMMMTMPCSRSLESGLDGSRRNFHQIVLESDARVKPRAAASS
jgi:hypothetical protein